MNWYRRAQIIESPVTYDESMALHQPGIVLWMWRNNQLETEVQGAWGSGKTNHMHFWSGFSDNEIRGRFDGNTIFIMTAVRQLGRRVPQLLLKTLFNTFGVHPLRYWS